MAVRADVQGGRAVELVVVGRDARVRGRGGRQRLGCPQLVVQGGELGGRERRAVGVERSGHRGEHAAGGELAARRLHRLQGVPDRLLERVDDVRRVGARVREVGGQDRRAGRRVGARRRVGLPAEPGGGVRAGRDGQAAEHHQAGHQGGCRVADDPDRDASPDAGFARAGLGLARPEHRPAENGQQRREQGQPGQQHHADADGKRDAQVGVEVEGGGQQGQQGRDDGGGRERDRLADPFHRRDHRLLLVLARTQVLAHPEDEEQAVVRARAEDQHDQQDLGQRRHLEAVLRGLGHQRS